MINAIQKNLVDILIAGAPMLCAGHSSCYAPGWAGLTRPRTNEAWNNAGASTPSVKAPTKGLINIYDRPYSKDTEETRPSIYIGIASHEYTDSDLGKQTSSGHSVSLHRNLDIPLVVVVTHPDPFICRDMRNQLRDNVMKVILSNIRSNSWWSLLAPGEAGGGNLAEHAWMSDTGQSGKIDAGMNEGFTVIPVRAKYSFTQTSIP